MAFLPAPAPVVSLQYGTATLDTGQNATLDWPDGNAAIGATGYGVLQSNNGDTPTPTASTIKIVLALAVLKQKPLKLNQAGPLITISANDVALYQNALHNDGSVVPVQEGEQLSEYQALQALLLPSGNNIAETLANWAFGSQQNYITYATNMLHGMGLSKTHLDDASGFSPKTVSTPKELVVIGEQAMQNAVFAKIVSQKQANLPVVGQVDNVNADLGQRDINGIKTGNTDEAGGCLVFSATRKVGNKDITVVGAVQALQGLQDALNAAPDLVDNSFSSLVYVAGMPYGISVGTVDTAWGAKGSVVATQDASQVVWAGTPIKRVVTTKPALSGVIGKATIGSKSTDLKVESTIPGPNIGWRLTHPAQIIRGLFE